jgi:NAD(P)-dependent dehydrogenase (short-subunit alcohol dehydrogenase family)
MRLEDKVVVITGSGSGLGRQGALMFAAEGATVLTSDVVADRRTARADRPMTVRTGTDAESHPHP